MALGEGCPHAGTSTRHCQRHACHLDAPQRGLSGNCLRATAAPRCSAGPAERTWPAGLGPSSAAAPSPGWGRSPGEASGPVPSGAAACWSDRAALGRDTRVGGDEDRRTGGQEASSIPGTPLFADCVVSGRFAAVTASGKQYLLCRVGLLGMPGQRAPD